MINLSLKENPLNSNELFVSKQLVDQLLPQSIHFEYQNSFYFEKAPTVGLLFQQDKENYSVLWDYLNVLKKLRLNVVFLSYTHLDTQLKNTPIQAILLPGGAFAVYEEWQSAKSAGGDLSRCKAYQFLADYAFQKNMPILGICAGFQMLTAYLSHGQILETKIPEFEIHHKSKAKKVHFVQLNEKGLLYSILKKRCIKVNSWHYFTPILKNESNPNIQKEAYCDSVLESISAPNKLFYLGVQWHPECLFLKQDKNSFKIFAAFKKAILKYQKKENK